MSETQFGSFQPDNPWVYPRYWKCCHCKATTRCLVNRTSIRPADGYYLPFHAAQTNGSRREESCPSCARRRCLLCIFLDSSGNELSTVGGNNLLPDRLVPAGWQCCYCKAELYGQPRRRVASHVFMESMHVARSSGRDGNNNNAPVRCFIAYKCHVQSGGCNHHICGDCLVLNRYGETLGKMGSAAGGQDTFQVVDGPLHLHRVWCRENLKWTWRTMQVNQRSASRNPKSGGLETLADAACWRAAREDLEEVRRIIERIEQWVRELRMRAETAQET